ncbi:hypothetical protein JL720_15825 [Aureococcus anophagefferens]|nr:hypothetical protein JL720_15825 [Aureococcus anophagefferens]
MSAEMPVVQGAVVAPGQVQPGIVQATVLQPVAVVIPQGAVVGTVVAVQGPGGPQNLAVPIGYKPGMTWNVAFPPAGHGQSLGLNGMAQLLGGADRIEINQKVNRLEAASCGCYEQKNRFEPPRAPEPACDESSVLVTLERKGCECNRCCFSTKPGLGCCSCTEACTEEIVLHEGKVEGKPGELDTGKALAYIRQPMQCCAAGGCTPTLDISEPGDGSVPHAQVTGPTCFGGCSELCCENHFDYTTVGGAAASGTITHLRPRGCCETCKAACTDSDNYGVEFGPSATPADKANMIAASIVVDYMFFEIDQGMCHYDAGNQQIVITCFLCFCYGCLIPCNCYIPTKADGARRRSRPPAPRRPSAILDAQPVAAEPPMRA